MSAHTGKIGRLSKDRREELGRRIEDGHAGPELAEWLNSLPDVQAVLQEKFEGRPINEQNLSAWRLSGHVNWLRRQEARAGMAELIGDSNQMDDAVGDWSLGERLGTVLAAELNAVGMALLSGETDLDKRWERLREIHREVSRLRQDDDRARRAALQQERWDRELEKQGVTMERVKRCTEEPEAQGPESKVGEASVERAVNGDETRQNKVNQEAFQVQSGSLETLPQKNRCPLSPALSPEGAREHGASDAGVNTGETVLSTEQVQGPKAEARDEGDERDIRDADGGAGAKVQFLLEERLPYPDEPGCEILYTQDNTYGTRYRKVPIGWKDPEGISPMKKEEAEARAAIPVNSQTGKSALLPSVPDALEAEVARLNAGGREDENDGRQGHEAQDQSDGDGGARADWDAEDERILKEAAAAHQRREAALKEEDEQRLAEENRLWRVEAGFEEPTEEDIALGRTKRKRWNKTEQEMA